MSVFSRFRRKRSAYRATTDEERMARYVYLLNTLPASVIESAHATAFRDLPAHKRREMFEQLRPFLADGERDTASDDPTVLARLVRRAEARRSSRAADGARRPADDPARTAVDTVDEAGPDPRDLMLQTGVVALVAHQFLMSTAIVSYFTVGAGSLTIGDEPAWVGDAYDPSGASAGGAEMGVEAGGYDGGAAGSDGGFGGFDGGGLGF